jgi:hypothetical protein
VSFVNGAQAQLGRTGVWCLLGLREGLGYLSIHLPLKALEVTFLYQAPCAQLVRQAH